MAFSRSYNYDGNSPTNGVQSITYTKFSDENQHQPLIIVPGRGETVFRWVEVVQNFLKLGYGPIYIMDHRGQGFSTRVAHKNLDVEHISDFHQYVQDLIYFIDHPMKRDLETLQLVDRPLYLIAHSMGAAVANLALIERPDIASKVTYVSPMFEIKAHSALLNAFHDKGAKFLAEFLCLIGCDEIPVGAQYDESENESTEYRRSYAQDAERNSHIHMSGSSPAWIREAIGATELIRKYASKYNTPSLIITASQDEVVENKATFEYTCQASDCSLVEIKGRHSLQLQSDQTLYQLIGIIHQYFSGDSADPGPKNWNSCNLSLSASRLFKFISKLFGRFHSQRGMWPLFIVVPSPCFNLSFRISQIVEEFFIE